MTTAEDVENLFIPWYEEAGDGVFESRDTFEWSEPDAWAPISLRWRLP